jgi:hypothetical protein
MKARVSHGQGARGTHRAEQTRGERVKLLMAAGLFLIAGGMLAWYYGWLPGFNGQEAAPALSAGDQARVAESQRIAEKERLRPDVIKGSS